MMKRLFPYFKGYKKQAILAPVLIALETICEKTGAEPVQCIGRRFVMYRPSKDNPRIVLE